jgi:hypothetical protein
MIFFSCSAAGMKNRQEKAVKGAYIQLDKQLKIWMIQ